MNSGCKKRTFFWCERLAIISLIAIMIDSCIFGAGEIIHIGPIGFRQILLLFFGVCCLPLFFARFKELIKNRFIWLIILFAAWLLFEAIRGFANGNMLNLMYIDFSGYVYYIFIPLTILVVDSRKKAEIIMRSMIVATFILALIVVAHLIIYLVCQDFYEDLASWGFNANFSRIGYVSSKIPRIYMISGLYMIASCAFSIYFVATENCNKFKWFYYLAPALCLFSTLLSYTRSVFLGFLAAAAVIVIYFAITLPKKIKKKIFVYLAGTAMITIAIAVSSSLIVGTNYIEYAISRSTAGMYLENHLGDDYNKTEIGQDKDQQDEQEKEQQQLNNGITIESDNIREITVKETIEHIKLSPIIGHGLGFNVPSREDGNEYTYLDIWMKTGIIGLILFLLPIVLVIVNVFKTKESEVFPKSLKITWLAFLFGILVYSIFNPYITSSLGIFVLGITLAVSQNLKSKDVT